jgi:two-component system LytT family response regulator
MNNEIIRVLIVDDEAPAREKLVRYVAECHQFKVVGEAKNGQEALDCIAQLQPQIILLDIQMPGMSGFDVLRLMDEHNAAVIFTTAFDDYAVKAFEVSAVDYLLKPISFSRLEQALVKASKHLKQNWQDKINTVLMNVASDNLIQRLPVRQGQRIKIINTQDISLIRSEHRLIHIYDHAGEKYWTNESLTQLEQRLDPQFFVRIHRNSIVNLSGKFEIKNFNSGRLKLYFDFAQEGVVSREHSTAFKQRLGL